MNLDGYSQPGTSPGSPLIEISGEDLPLTFAATPAALRGEDVERTAESLTLQGRLVRQTAAGSPQIGCRPQDDGCPQKRSTSGSTIRGLLFNYSAQTALQLFGTDNVTVTGNYFGLDVTGENPAPNGRRPEDVFLFSLLLNGASDNVIGTPGEPNYFGVTRSHSVMMWPFTAVDGSGECGAQLSADAVRSRMDIGSSRNVVQANSMGLNNAGTRSLDGLCIWAGSDRRFAGEGGCEAGRTLRHAIYATGGPQIYVYFYPGDVPVSRNSMRGNRIGGLGTGERNRIAAAWTGVTVKGVGTEISGNNFGLAADGLGAAEIGPFYRGAVVIRSDSQGTLVEGNIVANSVNLGTVTASSFTYGAGGGIAIAGGPTGPGFSDNLAPQVIRQNLVGVNVRGVCPGNNLVGLPATNAGGGVTSIWMFPARIENNVIAYNGYLGVAAVAARMLVLNPNTANEQTYVPRRLVVLGNSMFCNGSADDGQICGHGLGIDWSASQPPLPAPAIGDGPTLNDPGDMDDGPAKLQNYPLLTAVRGGISGTLNSAPNTTYRIQFFTNPLDSGRCMEVTTTIQPGFVPDPVCGVPEGRYRFSQSREIGGSAIWMSPQTRTATPGFSRKYRPEGWSPRRRRASARRVNRCIHRS